MTALSANGAVDSRKQSSGNQIDSSVALATTPSPTCVELVVAGSNLRRVTCVELLVAGSNLRRVTCVELAVAGSNLRRVTCVELAVTGSNLRRVAQIHHIPRNNQTDWRPERSDSSDALVTSHCSYETWQPSKGDSSDGQDVHVTTATVVRQEYRCRF